ncbi:alpha/beta fold hydrolase [Streptomyces platensis]|uniref:alpha/beta fold hydrolase n=1 Tax=Streptomyces platensis TaxID=58346 RepID=UPI00368A11AF
MAAGRPPVAVAALQEKAVAAAWKEIPGGYLVATEDRNIPPAAEQWMAERASARTITVRAPHAVAGSDPGPRYRPDPARCLLSGQGQRSPT